MQGYGVSGRSKLLTGFLAVWLCPIGGEQASETTGVHIEQQSALQRGTMKILALTSFVGPSIIPDDDKFPGGLNFLSSDIDSALHYHTTPRRSFCQIGLFDGNRAA